MNQGTALKYWVNSRAWLNTLSPQMTRRIESKSQLNWVQGLTQQTQPKANLENWLDEPTQVDDKTSCLKNPTKSWLRELIQRADSKSQFNGLT